MGLRNLAIAAYRRLPLPVAVALSRRKPNLAFYIKPGPRDLVVDDYLGEFRVHVDTYSHIERRLLSRRYEPDALAVIARFVRPGQVCCDVGANVGAISLALAQAVGPSGRVESFEAGPPFFERLRRNLALNPALGGRVRAHPVGLSDGPGVLLWQESPNDPGNASILWADPSRPGVDVPLTTLDAFARDHGLDALHFLKIDVEGMELQVLKGGLDTLRRHAPAVYFETSLCDDQQRESARAIEALLTGLGYRLYKILDDHGSIRPTRFPDFSANTLALPLPPEAGRAGDG